MKKKLTHFDARGQARMVDVAEKLETHRIARAGGRIRMRPATLRQILAGSAKKGDVLGVARLAAIQAAKRTSDLIPLCHPLLLDHVEVRLELTGEGVSAESTVRCVGRTGVEMEALAAVSVALLTVYDMCKSVDPRMSLGPIHLVEKTKSDATEL